jgi:hypothetical protein
MRDANLSTAVDKHRRSPNLENAVALESDELGTGVALSEEHAVVKCIKRNMRRKGWQAGSCINEQYARCANIYFYN